MAEGAGPAAVVGQTAQMATARHATPADVDPLADALTAAFATDPLWRWMIPDGDRWWRRAPAMFAHEVAGRTRQGHTYTTDDRAGVALWAPPGLWRTPWTGMVGAVPSMLALTGVAGGRRGLGLLRAIEAAHPEGHHWYLAVLGTHPDHRHRGVASAVLRPVLDRCDLDGTGAYLESSNPENIPFYERHGFRVTDEVRPGGSPPVALMWRDPHPPSDP